MSTGVFQLQRSHSSLGNQHAHLLQYRPTVLESNRYHHPNISRTCHNRSHRFVHSPLHASTCRSPICLIIRHRYHDDVDSRHPKYTVSSAPISTGGPFLTSFPHSHGNRSVYLSLTRHTTSVSSPFLHFTSGPVHCLLSATPCHPFTCVLNCTRSCVVWLVDSGWRLSLLPPSQ